MRVLNGINELAAAVGQQLGYSNWHTVTQDQVNQFADATEDHQWIHVDLEKARSGPFGATIAHGYLTLSLVPILSTEVYKVTNLSMGINYGVNRARFPTPVLVGSRIRAGIKLLKLSQTPKGAIALTQAWVEIEGESKPACVVESLTLYVP